MKGSSYRARIRALAVSTAWMKTLRPDDCLVGSSALAAMSAAALVNTKRHSSTSRSSYRSISSTPMSPPEPPGPLRERSVVVPNGKRKLILRESDQFKLPDEDAVGKPS